MNSMAPDAQASDLPMHREVLEEERRLREALKRIRLEDAAKSPITSKRGWSTTVLLVICLGVPYFDNQYQWFIASFVIVTLMVNDRRVHSRIDAIQELAELDKEKAEAAGARQI
jgi:hypothetical protein